jgi:hypothetical protein
MLVVRDVLDVFVREYVRTYVQPNDRYGWMFASVDMGMTITLDRTNMHAFLGA